MLHIGTKLLHPFHHHFAQKYHGNFTMEMSRVPGKHLWSCHHLHQAFPLQAWLKTWIFSRDKNGSKCWVYGHMMPYVWRRLLNYGDSWWYHVIYKSYWWLGRQGGAESQIRHQMGQPNDGLFGGSISLTDAHNVLHGIRMQIQYTPMLDGLTRPQGPLWTQIGFIRDLEKEKTKMKRSHMLRSSQFCPGPGFIEHRTIGSSAFHCQDHRELCRMITMVVADEDRRGDASCSCLTWISIHNVFI